MAWTFDRLDRVYQLGTTMWHYAVLIFRDGAAEQLLEAKFDHVPTPEERTAIIATLENRLNNPPAPPETIDDVRTKLETVKAVVKFLLEPANTQRMTTGINAIENWSNLTAGQRTALLTEVRSLLITVRDISVSLQA